VYGASKFAIEVREWFVMLFIICLKSYIEILKISDAKLTLYLARSGDTINVIDSDIDPESVTRSLEKLKTELLTALLLKKDFFFFFLALYSLLDSIIYWLQELGQWLPNKKSFCFAIFVKNIQQLFFKWRA